MDPEEWSFGEKFMRNNFWILYTTCSYITLIIAHVKKYYNDKDFSQFFYLGKEKPPITLFEFFKIDQELRENPIKVKKGIYGDIQEERRSRNQKPLAESTFYRHVKQEV